MSIHQGHRQRLKNRFLKEGLDNFEPIQVLELLLFYAVPRVDTNPLAHALLERFGSLSAVLEATPAQLKAVEGIGDSAATFLSLVTAASRYYQRSTKEDCKILSTVDECGSYLTPCFHGQKNEVVFLLCMDAKGKVLSCLKVGEGSVNSASVPIRRIVEMAMGTNASSVVLAHNHPSGLAIPSSDDVQTTRRLAIALDAVDIQLWDHIIVADDEFVSLAQSALYRPGECRALV